MAQMCWLVNSLLTLENNDLNRPPPSKPRMLEETQAIPDERDSLTLSLLLLTGVGGFSLTHFHSPSLIFHSLRWMAIIGANCG